MPKRGSISMKRISSAASWTFLASLFSALVQPITYCPGSRSTRNHVSCASAPSLLPFTDTDIFTARASIPSR